VLSRAEQINVDYCANCYWIVYMQCIVGDCQVQFAYDVGQGDQGRMHDGNNVIRNGQLIKQNKLYRFNSINCK